MSQDQLSQEQLRRRIFQLMHQRVDDNYFALGQSAELRPRSKKRYNHPYEYGAGGQLDEEGGALLGGAKGSCGGRRSKYKSEKKRMGGRKASSRNPWIAHVKQVQKKYGISYGEALKRAKSSYKRR